MMMQNSGNNKISLLFIDFFQEKLANGGRIWYKDYDKGFLLPTQVTKHAIPINPIKIDLNERNVKHGIVM